MEYKTLGRTKLKASAIGFGGGPLQETDLLNAKRLILTARSLGINLIDADKVHKDTEKKIGLALKQSKKNIIVSTKSFAITREQMTKEVIQSLKALQLHTIDIYNLHMIENENDLNKRLKGSFISLKKARSEGKIKFIGFSGHHIPTLIKAIKTNEFDTALIPYNPGHTLADELLDIAKEHEVGIMVMKPLGGGFLVDPKFNDETPRKSAKHMTAENALRFVLSDKRIDTVLVGFQHTKEVEEAVRIGNQKLNMSYKERLAIRNRISKFLGNNSCRNCKYCMPCEANRDLDIARVLKLQGYYSKYGYKNNPILTYNSLKVKADACTECGICEKKCPYNLHIRKMLKEAHKNLNFKNLEEKIPLISLIKKFKEDLERKEKEINNLQRLTDQKEHEFKKFKDSLNEELQDYNQEILKLEKDSKKIKELLKLEKLKSEEKYKETKEELKRIYHSKGYRYILLNIWKISNCLLKNKKTRTA